MWLCIKTQPKRHIHPEHILVKHQVSSTWTMPLRMSQFNENQVVVVDGWYDHLEHHKMTAKPSGCNKAARYLQTSTIVASESSVTMPPRWCPSLCPINLNYGRGTEAKLDQSCSSIPLYREFGLSDYLGNTYCYLGRTIQMWHYIRGVWHNFVEISLYPGMNYGSAFSRTCHHL